MHGNRDFLLGEAFAERIGATLHRDDELVVELAGRRALLLHGDTLCTNDVEYQRARPTLRSAAWQAEQLGKSVAERLGIARAMRAGSRGADAIVDASPDEVDARFRATGATLMVHGHVHRPAAHAGPAGPDGKETRRLVVGDWHDDGAVVALVRDGGIGLTAVADV